MPKIAVVTLDGFNEIDSFVASYMLGRVNRPGWSVSIACPSPQVTSMNGLTINAQMSLDELPTAEADADVVDQPFFAAGNVATAGGCLSSQYLAAWVIARLADDQTARDALFYVAPVGEKDEYVARAMRHVQAFLPAAAST